MKKNFSYILFALAVLIFLIPYTSITHAGNKVDHQANKHKTKKYKRRVKKRKSDKLVILNIMPKSGKSREAGFDGSYAMETTTLLDSDFTLCAKASRGLIMLDNAMLKKCGGRASGWSTEPVKTK
ncbi:MAG: hypothetical protein ACC653_12050 [Gammaproteobacteria bacterium]